MDSTAVELVDDCVNCFIGIGAVEKEHVITCLITVAVGAVIRFFEKRKMKKQRKY